MSAADTVTLPAEKGEGKEFFSKLLKLLIPVALQQFMLSLVSATDAVMLGHMSQNAMSAVSLAGQVQNVFSIFMATFGYGINILVAQYWGKGDKGAVQKILGFVWKMSIPLSLGFTLVALLMPNTVMGWLTSSQTLRDLGVEYLRAVALSYLFCGISQPYLSIMKNTGMAAKSALISSVCVVLNTVLNAILIFGLCGAPALGITGAAIATVISRLVEAVWALISSRKETAIKIDLGSILHTDMPLFKDYWHYTTPVLLNTVFWGFGSTLESVIMGHIGEDAVAANSVAIIVRNLMSSLASGTANGGAILLGNEMGAGNLPRAKRYGDRLMALATVNGAVMAALVIGVGFLVAQFSTLTATATAYLRGMILMCGYFMMGRSLNSAANSGIFRAGGDVKFGLYMDIITMWGIVLPLAALGAFVWKLPVMWVYFFLSLDETVKIPAVLIHYKKYRWVKNITK